MIRMGRGNRTEEAESNEQTPTDSGYRYTNETQAALGRGAISEEHGEYVRLIEDGGPPRLALAGQLAGARQRVGDPAVEPRAQRAFATRAAISSRRAAS